MRSTSSMVKALIADANGSFPGLTVEKFQMICIYGTIFGLISLAFLLWYVVARVLPATQVQAEVLAQAEQQLAEEAQQAPGLAVGAAPAPVASPSARAPGPVLVIKPIR